MTDIRRDAALLLEAPRMHVMPKNEKRELGQRPWMGSEAKKSLLKAASLDLTAIHCWPAQEVGGLPFVEEKVSGL